MRGKSLTAATLVFLALVGAAHASERLIGNWIVTVTRDRFSENEKIIAVTAQSDGLFAVRCFDGELTLALGAAGVEGELKPGDLFQIKFRADRNAVIETVGVHRTKA